MEKLRQHGRLCTLLMAAGALMLVLLAILMTQLWMLNACYLCMFQRLLYLGIMLALLVATGFWKNRRLAGGGLFLAGLIALGGIGVAGYQSWLQWFPQLELSCGTGSQNLMEQTVEWLGRLAPTVFMATGFCEDDSFRIFALSLANWSLLSFMALAGGCFVLLYSRVKAA